MSPLREPNKPKTKKGTNQPSLSPRFPSFSSRAARQSNKQHTTQPKEAKTPKFKIQLREKGMASSNGIDSPFA